jgi:3'-phosphoadenosine 5'-phosphosulfate sulfotransferase (PAPS reductase)/FAD synthetase
VTVTGPSAHRPGAASQGTLFTLAVPDAAPSDLSTYDVILANISGGKDSQTMLRVLVTAAEAAGVRDRVVCVFADLGEDDEWPGTAELAAEHAACYGLRFITVCRMITDSATGEKRQQGLLEYIEHRGGWPTKKNRFCTSDLKRGPIRTVMTCLVAEARAGGITGRRVRLLNVMGLRAQESPDRRLMSPFSHDAESSNKTRREVDQWLPIHAWTLEEVWADIHASGVRYHWAYDLGLPRLSCQFCLGGETEVVTRDGLRPIRELAGGQHPLLIPRGTAYGISSHGTFGDVDIRSFGVQPLLRVMMHRGRQRRIVYATAEHRWLTLETKPRPLRPDGTRGGYECVTCEQATAQLVPGTELRSLKAQPPTKTGMVRFAVAQGFVYGDGHLAGGDRPAALHIYDHVKDGAILPFFGGHKITQRTIKGKPVSAIYGLPRLWKARPDLRESRAFLLSWLAGYFAADGCVTPDGSAQISSASLDSMQVVRDVAAVCGIGYGPVRTDTPEGFPGRPKSALHTITLNAADLPAWFFIIAAHRERIAAKAATRETRERRWVIDSVTPTDRYEEVFCAVVPGVHAFALGEDLMTGNCVLASTAALVLSAQANPAGAAKRLAVERRMAYRRIVATLAVIWAMPDLYHLPRRPGMALLRRAWRGGHQFKHGLSMAQIIAMAQAAPRPAAIGDWAA